MNPLIEGRLGGGGSFSLSEENSISGYQISDTRDLIGHSYSIFPARWLVAPRRMATQVPVFNFSGTSGSLFSGCENESAIETVGNPHSRAEAEKKKF